MIFVRREYYKSDDQSIVDLIPLINVGKTYIHWFTSRLVEHRGCFKDVAWKGNGISRIEWNDLYLGVHENTLEYCTQNKGKILLCCGSETHRSKTRHGRVERKNLEDLVVPKRRIDFIYARPIRLARSFRGSSSLFPVRQQAYDENGIWRRVLLFKTRR